MAFKAGSSRKNGKRINEWETEKDSIQSARQLLKKISVPELDRTNVYKFLASPARALRAVHKSLKSDFLEWGSHRLNGEVRGSANLASHWDSVHPLTNLDIQQFNGQSLFYFSFNILALSLY